MNIPLSLSDGEVWALLHNDNLLDAKRVSDPVNVEALFSVVAGIMGPSIGYADPSVQFAAQENDEAYPSYVHPVADLIKHIAGEMVKTPPDEHDFFAHKTTMNILSDLDDFSWCANAVIALAAFALEYRNFWQLLQVSRDDDLGRSLAELNNHVFQAIERNQRDIVDYNLVVKAVFSSVESIVRLETISKQGYDFRDIPTLEIATQEFPVLVHWIVLSIVICARHIDILLSRSTTRTYELSNIGSKISSVLSKLKDFMKKIEIEKGVLYEYLELERVFGTSTEIVQVLKCLLFPKTLENPQVYEGSPRRMVSINVFRQKYVLLFISGLYNIADEIRLLKSIYESLKTDPNTVKGFKKGDFKILWAPIVDEGEILECRECFEDLMDQMEWYVVEYSIIPSMCKKLIKQKLKYQNKPMVPVFDPQGGLTNDDALHMLFTWGDAAFPWRKDDDLDLSQSWDWLWTEMTKVNPEIDTWIREEAYIIIYGRTDMDYFDDQWLLRIPDALEEIKRNEITRRSDIVIKYYHHGKRKDELRTVYAFWAFVEHLFDSMKKRTTKHRSFDEVKAILGLRHEHSGWVFLSQGTKMIMLCRGDTFYQTLREFDMWKMKIVNSPGFEAALLSHYEHLFSSLPVHANCLRLDLKYHVSDIYAPIYCLCGRKLDIKFVSYECCHGYEEEHVDAADLEVRILR